MGKLDKVPCVSLAMVIIVSIVLGILVNSIVKFSGSTTTMVSGGRIVKYVGRLALFAWFIFSVWKNTTPIGCTQTIGFKAMSSGDSSNIWL